MAHQHHDPAPAGAVAHASHGSADDEYLVTPPGAGHEHTDAGVGIIIKFGVWLVFVLLVQWKEGGDPEFPLAQGQERRLPAGAQLQPIPANDIFRFRLQEDDVLRNYRWIDRQGGRAQIPIDEAMRLTVERGLPARVQAPDAADPAAPPLTPGLLPADSSSGRTMERRRQ